MSVTELTSTSDGTAGGDATANAVSRSGHDDPGAAAGEPSDRGRDQIADGPDRTASPGKDVVFDILKNERRRRTLQYLREEPTTTLSDLAEHVAALENDKTVGELTSSERKRVYVGLYQCHLPKMADAGLIDYDRSRGTIRLREAASPCFVYLDIDPEDGSTGDGDLGRLRGWLASVASILRPSTTPILGGR